VWRIYSKTKPITRGAVNDVMTMPATESVRSATLRSHTFGLTAEFLHTSVVGAPYRPTRATAPPPSSGSALPSGMRWSAYAAMPKPLGSERRMTFLQADRTCRGRDPVV
jgi:hypothetical protein